MNENQSIPDNVDEAKGRLKESAGDLIGDDELKEEGQTDQASGKVKSVIDDAADKAKQTADDIKEKLS